MDSLNHTTFSVKREPDFSPGLGFQSSVQHQDATKDPGPLDMDLASFLGEPGVASKFLNPCVNLNMYNNNCN